MIWDALTGERIGADWLRVALAPTSDFGRRAEDAARPFGPGDEAAAAAACAGVVALAGDVSAEGVAHLRAALRRAPDPVDIVSRATAGDPLGDVDFFEIGRFADALDATARAWDAAGGPAHRRPPIVSEIVARLGPGRTTAGGFYLADSFASGLAPAREAYAAADAAVERERRRLAAALAARLGTLPESEEFIVMRDAVPQLPPGIRVIRETPAYRLVAIELDADALAADAARAAAAARVAQVEEAARLELAAAVARCGPAILAAARALGELDRTLARVAFTQQWGGCVPRFDPGRFAFEEASLVPLRAARIAEGLPYTPISLDLRGVCVLTGPNMGGKSAALATCGFLAACVAAGVPPPAARATLPLAGSVAWIGGDARGERARLLSAFGAEVVRTREVLAAARPPALILVDEFARTTGPREGRALLVALVEALVRRGAFALLATHFDDVARDAGVRHLTIAGLGPRALDDQPARDIHAALDAVAQAMDYRIILAEGAPQRSDALALAGLLGLDPAIVGRAAELYARTGPAVRVNE